MQLPRIPLVILDTETTGFVPRANRVIEFASVRLEDGTIVDEYEQLISIPTEIPAQVVALTHITNEHLKRQPPFEQVSDTIRARIGEDAIIVGQNVGFDIGMLKGEGIDLSARPWIDTSMLASLVFPELESYSLGYVSTVLNLRHEPVHRALGDVHATLELLGKCWERLLELPEELLQPLQYIMQKAPSGYKMLFRALPPAQQKAPPSWLTTWKKHVERPLKSGLSLPMPEQSAVQVVEEPIDADYVRRLLVEEKAQGHSRKIIAVKNLHATLRSLGGLPPSVTVLQPPEHILDRSRASTLAMQESFTADEATLATKLAWYEPSLSEDLPLHGEERNVWSGKMACTQKSVDYTQQITGATTVVLIDHRQLLMIIADEKHPARLLLSPDTHIIIDDASMLEDTATKAYGWYCALDSVRAAAEGDPALTKLTDHLQLWLEQTRRQLDVYYLKHADLTTPECRGLLEQLSDALDSGHIPPGSPAHEQLTNARMSLSPEHLNGRIAWIEQRQNGNQSLQSVPAHIGSLLQQSLYERFLVTLLIPPRSAQTLAEILPERVQTVVIDTPLTLEETVPVRFDNEQSIRDFLSAPPQGKSIILINSRGKIEELFVSFAAPLEEKGIGFICQNLSGGMGRMQAEYGAAKNSCIWVLTPWSFEGVELVPESIDRLVIETIPFDHPSHTVLSKRAEHYRDSFSQYSLPRAEHRLFRLLKTFCRYRSPGAEVLLLDKRIEQKTYGKTLWSYLKTITTKEPEEPIHTEKPLQPSLFS